MNPEEIRARVRDARVARLATIRVDGSPHLVPFCFVLDDDVLYSAVDRKPKRTGALRRLENTAAEPRVCVLVDHYEEDWSRLWWIRLDGLARQLEPGPETDRALAALAEKYSQYRAAPPPGPVLRIEVNRWSAWTAWPPPLAGGGGPKGRRGSARSSSPQHSRSERGWISQSPSPQPLPQGEGGC